jgi:Common central domain of tyrosinase
LNKALEEIMMALGDRIRRNIASVDPTERALLRNALVALNQQIFPGSRTDQPAPGGVSWWFKQDEIHAATHVHDGPEFIPWHREIVNRLEEMLRVINQDLSLHYWDWTQDPRAIPNANLGGGVTGTLNLFTSEFMGYGGSTPAPIGEPWLSAGYYVPGANLYRDGPGGTAADPPQSVVRSVVGSPASTAGDTAIVNAPDYPTMWRRLRVVHDAMHNFVRMGGAHISFRDPFVFLLHSNVDRLFALWQRDPAHPERLDPNTVYGAESNLDVQVVNVIQNLNHNIEPWSTGHSFDQFGGGHFTRPWYAPENQGVPKTYKDPTVVTPRVYDWPLAWNGPGTLTTVSHPRCVAGHFSSADQRHLVIVGTSAGKIHEVFWKPAQIGIEGEDDVPVTFAAGTIVSVGTIYNSDQQRHVVLVGTAAGKVREIFWKSDTVGIEGQDDLPVAFAANSIVGVAGLYDSTQQRHIAIVGTSAGKVYEIFWKADTVGVEGHDDLPVAFSPGSIVGVAALYDSDQQRYVVVVGTSAGRLHEIYWKADTVGIEGHDNLPAAFDPRSIVAVSGCYDSSRKRYIIAVGLADGTVRQVYWKPSTVGVEANSVVAKLTANSIVGVSAFYSVSDNINHIVVARSNGQLQEFWVAADV